MRMMPCKALSIVGLACLRKAKGKQLPALINHLQSLQILVAAVLDVKFYNSDSVLQTSISLPFITATADGPKHIETNLSRAKFEELASDLLDRCRIPVEQALKDANLAVSDINEVILVGGSTRIPAVQVLFPPEIFSSVATGHV